MLAGQSYVIKCAADSTSGTVNIDLLAGSSPASATLVSNIVTGAANSGTYAWAVPSNTLPGSNYYIRVTHTGSPSATAEIAAAFTIKAPMTTFYINDGTVARAITRPNRATTPTTACPPPRRWPRLPAAANLRAGAGDMIMVDNGTYNIAGNIVLTAANSGLKIEGYFNSSSPTLTSKIVRGSTVGGSYVFNIQGATNLTLDHLSITGAEIGVVVGDNSGSTGLKITNDQIYSNLDDGIYLGVGNNGG